MYFMVQKGFIYTIAVYIYAFCLAFSIILPCVLHQNALRFAPKCLAFCTKIDRVLHQNTSRLAPKCVEFSDKQPKNGYELRFYAMCIHFTCIYNSPLFAPKQTSARIDFLRQGWRLVGRKGTHNVKTLTKN